MPLTYGNQTFFLCLLLMASLLIVRGGGHSLIVEMTLPPRRAKGLSNVMLISL